jgi:hypothetical protein
MCAAKPTLWPTSFAFAHLKTQPFFTCGLRKVPENLDFRKIWSFGAPLSVIGILLREAYSDRSWDALPYFGIFNAPEHFETSAMPSQDGLRLNHLGRTKKARPEPGHPYEQHAITAAKAKARWRSPQSNGELMTEKQILRFKPGPRLE